MLQEGHSAVHLQGRTGGAAAGVQQRAAATHQGAATTQQGAARVEQAAEGEAAQAGGTGSGGAEAALPPVVSEGGAMAQLAAVAAVAVDAGLPGGEELFLAGT